MRGKTRSHGPPMIMALIAIVMLAVTGAQARPDVGSGHAILTMLDNGPPLAANCNNNANNVSWVGGYSMAEAGEVTAITPLTTILVLDATNWGTSQTVLLTASPPGATCAFGTLATLTATYDDVGPPAGLLCNPQAIDANTTTTNTVNYADTGPPASMANIEPQATGATLNNADVGTMIPNPNSAATMTQTTITNTGPNTPLAMTGDAGMTNHTSAVHRAPVPLLMYRGALALNSTGTRG